MTKRKLRLNGAVTYSSLFPGVHRVRSKLASGKLVEFWYQWRGGPRILRVEADTEAGIQAAIQKQLPHLLQIKREDKVTLYGLITRYLESPEWLQKDYSKATREETRRYLDLIRTQIGTIELRALESRHAKKAIYTWRDTFADRPRTADLYMMALDRVLKWAVKRDELARNPIEGWERLYTGTNRAQLIWEPQQLEQLLKHSTPWFQRVVLFAAFTGARMEDCVTMQWSAVREHSLVYQTSKSRHRSTAVVPIVPALRTLLDATPRVSTHILTTVRGRPWTTSTLKNAMGAAKRAAGIEGLTFHDLKGTAVTHFIRAGLEVEQVATLVGWETRQVRQIALRYVTHEEVAMAMLKRLAVKQV